ARGAPDAAPTDGRDRFPFPHVLQPETLTTIARPRYLSASHHTLTDSTLRSHPAHQTRHPKMPRAFGTVSLMCFGTVGCVSVPEYQLVIHRLRLSASP